MGRAGLLVRKEPAILLGLGALLAGICRPFSTLLARLFPPVLYPLYDWARPYNLPQKRADLIYYAALSASYACCFAFLVLRRREERAPGRVHRRAWDARLERYAGKGSVLWPLSLAALFLQLLAVVLPFVNGKFQMINEFWDLPESTRLGAAGDWVDNTDYINRYGLLGLHKQDIRRTGAPPPGKREEISMPAMLEFLEKNHFELGKQILDRWVMHHHDFMLAPMMELALGKDKREIYAQYGMGNAILLEWILAGTGGITYQNYFRVLYAFWPLYYAGLAAVLLGLFKDVRYVVLAFLLAMAAVNAIGFDTLFVGPGLNPIRHLLDLPILACVGLYSRNKKPAFLAAAYLFCFLAVLQCRQFGLLALASLTAAWPFAAWEDARRPPLAKAALAAAALSAGVGLSRWGVLGTDPFSRYWSSGFISFPVKWYFFPAFILSLALGYMILARGEGKRHPLRLPALFLFAYAQAALSYYVWGGTPDHLLNVAPIIVAAGIVLLKLLMDSSGGRGMEASLLSAAAAAAFLGVYAPAVRYFGETRRNYDRIFTAHKTYRWDLPFAKFESTMDPVFFERAASLIRKYAPQDAVYLLSRYDIVLPFLAGKYSAMPYFHVSYSLMTEAETSRCAERIEKDKPAFLFVDSDMNRDRRGDIIQNYPSPFKSWGDPMQVIGVESLVRVQRLRHLADLFDRVRKDYEPMERGMLITVYRRKARLAEKRIAQAG